MQQLHKQPARAPGIEGRNGKYLGQSCHSELSPPEPAFGRRGPGGGLGLQAGSSSGGAGGPREEAEAPGRALEAARAGRASSLQSPHGWGRAAVAAALTGPGWDGRCVEAEGKMSALLEQKEQQERLREAAALGDIREVQKLVESGVDVNSQNEVNGW